MDVIKLNGLNIISARCGGGKTVLIKYVVYKLFQEKLVNNVIVFTMTAQDYSYLPSECVHTNINQYILASILQYQKNHPNLSMLLIMDDFIGSINFQWPICNVLNSQYRHYNLTIIYSTQYIYKLPPLVREVSDVAILFNQNTERSVKACFESFGQDFQNLSEFQEFLQNRTQGYQFLIIDNKSNDRTKKFKKAVVDINKIPTKPLTFSKSKS